MIRIKVFPLIFVTWFLLMGETHGIAPLNSESQNMGIKQFETFASEGNVDAFKVWDSFTNKNEIMETALRLLRHPKSETRNIAAHCLTSIYNTSVTTAFVKALKDPSKEVRSTVYMYLNAYADNSVLQELITNFQNYATEIRIGVALIIGIEFGYDRAVGGGNAYVYRADGTPKDWNDVSGGKYLFKKWYDTFSISVKSIERRFWIEDLGAANRYFRNIYLHFFPIILSDPFNGINLQPFTNYDIIVHLNDSVSVGMRVGKVLQIGNNTSPSWIVRYILGRDDGSISPTANLPVDITNLTFLQNWLRKKLGSATLSLKGA